VRRKPAKSKLIGAGVALAAVLALGVAPSAEGTANIIPNPGFEQDCSGVPCGWANHSAGTTVARDMSTFHSGAASIRVGGPAGGSNEANTGCLPLTLTPGINAISFWYNWSDPDVSAVFVALLVEFYSTSNCSVMIGIGTGLGDVSGHSGGWFQATGANTVPPNAVAVIFRLSVPCFVTGPCSMNFDDLDFEAELPVTLFGFRAARSHRGVVVRWRTGTEVDTLGFNVYRQRGGRRVRLNRRLIPALGSSHGGVRGGLYSFVDRQAPKRQSLRYWLQDVDTSGHRTWHGPVRVAAA
jgi:hypothetical protein